MKNNWIDYNLALLVIYFYLYFRKSSLIWRQAKFVIFSLREKKRYIYSLKANFEYVFFSDDVTNDCKNISIYDFWWKKNIFSIDLNIFIPSTFLYSAYIFDVCLKFWKKNSSMKTKSRNFFPHFFFDFLFFACKHEEKYFSMLSLVIYIGR